MIASFGFWGPHSILFGNGEVARIGKEARRLGGNRVLVVTDRVIAKVGILEKVRASLEEEGLQVGVFDGTEPEPTLRNYNECLKIVSEGGYDLVVGLGGGSSMDLAKAVALVGGIGGPIKDYFGIDRVPKRGLPTIMVCTTSGTGSEVSKFAILTDQDTNLKMAIVSPYILANVAIVDPTLTLSMPPSVTAATGMDALTHAIEGYVAVKSSPLTDALALEAARIIGRSLRPAVADGRNLEARAEMALASMIGGQVLTTTGGAGAVHGLAFALGVHYHLPHGLANSLVLPYVLEYTAMSSVPKLVKVAEALGEPSDGKSDREYAGSVVRAIFQLQKDIGVPIRLRDVGVEREKLPVLARDAAKQERVLLNTPRQLTEKEILAIFESAY